MKNDKLLMVPALLATACGIAPAETPQKPNIVFMLADDMGIGDVGCYGQKLIKTPNIDALAGESMLFSHHYSGSTVSAPSRCCLMTGKHTGHAFVRGNKGEKTPLGGFDIHLPGSEVTVAEILKSQGYATACVGKWGLGGPGTEGSPVNQGYDYFYGYLSQGAAHRYYPEYLYENESKDMLNGEVYSHFAIMEKGLQFIRDNADRPFFTYFSVTTPHADLDYPDFRDYEEAFPETPYVNKSKDGKGYMSQPKPKVAYASMVSEWATAECGVNVAARVPEYLNAYEYVTLYNEARANDGLAPKYSPEQIEGYRNSAGPNDLLYPDVDWYDYFTRNTSTYKNFMVDMTGGTDRIRYSLILNYKRGTGFESVGKLPSLDRFNIRGNIDVKVTDYLNVFADAAARLEVREWGQRNMSSVYGALSGNRPNEYPLMIAAEDLGLAPNEDGVPFFGANNRSAGNLLADMKYGGFNAERYINSMVNLGLDFDFDIFVKGLKAKAALMYDNYSYFGQGQTNIYPTYAIRGTNMDDIEFVQMRKQSLQSNQSRTSDNFNQTLGFYARTDYSRVFGKHGLDAGLLYNYYQNEVNGSGQNHRNENLNLRVLYDYDQRYAIEATGSLMGSARYAKGNRHFLAYAVGASWIISNEPFLKSAPGVDFLKLRASFGHLGFDRNTGYLLYKTAWSNGGNYTLGEHNKGTVERTTSFVCFGKDVKWEYSNELNIGIDGSFLGHRLNVTVDGFRETRNNIVTAQSADLAAVHGGFVTVVNGGSVRNWGMDGRISWNDRVGDFHYEIGVNATWTANKLLSWNQVNYPDGGTVAVGKPTDAMFGYTALGLFGRDVALDGAPLQHFGDYGNGSIAYADTNNDGHVDSRDRTMIGNRFPRLTSGIDVRLGYKGWELFLCGTAQTGKWSLNDNSFWQMDGEDKYSVIALERYHPENNPSGKYPSLTTRSAASNFVNSTFWLQNASFFRLKDAELSYTFDFLKAGVKKLRLFVRGTNLFVISADGHLDPETVNAGVSTYPLYKTITGGASITF